MVPSVISGDPRQVHASRGRGRARLWRARQELAGHLFGKYARPLRGRTTLAMTKFSPTESPNLDRALHATERIDPATALPFEIVSKIFVHVYEAAPLLRRSDQIAHTVACVNTQWRDIALAHRRLHLAVRQRL